MILCILFYSESISMKASYFAVLLQAFYTEARPRGIRVLFAQLGCIDCTMLECGNMVLHLEFSVWNSAHQT